MYIKYLIFFFYLWELKVYIDYIIQRFNPLVFCIKFQ